MDDDAARRRAALARRAERRPEDPVEREVEVGVVHDDDRVLAAELEVDVLQPLGGGLEHLDAGLARAGERDDGDVGMPHEPLADRAPAAVDDVDDAVRDAGLGEELDEALPERGRVRRRLEDDGVPGDERGRDLPGRDRDREVPRRDDADDADRHPDGHLELVPKLGRGRLPEEAPALAAHVVAHVDRFLHVAAGLGLHLPHLVRHEVGELGLVVGDELREAEEDLAALRCRDEAPLRERRLRGRDRAVDVVGAGAREGADQLAVGGARRVEGLAGGGVDPLAVDVVLKRACLCRRHGRAAYRRRTSRASERRSGRRGRRRRASRSTR